MRPKTGEEALKKRIAELEAELGEYKEAFGGLDDAARLDDDDADTLIDVAASSGGSSMANSLPLPAPPPIPPFLASPVVPADDAEPIFSFDGMAGRARRDSTAEAATLGLLQLGAGLDLDPSLRPDSAQTEGGCASPRPLASLTV